MISDLADRPDGSVLEADLCIVGAGPAGIAIARALRGKGLNILLLESGGAGPEDGPQALAKGTVDGPLAYRPLENVRLRQLGGTTGHWAGQSHPLDAADFDTRAWVPLSGWPVAYDDFAAYLPAAAELCQLGEESFDYDAWKGQKGMTPNPFGAGVHIVPLRFSKPIARFGQLYKDDLDVAADITCVLHATVTALTPNASGTAVVGATVKTLGGKTATVKAKRFVLAAGLENARLLLLSQAASGKPFGNEHDMVGRCVMEHPRVDTGTVALEQRDAVEFVRKAARKVGSHSLRFDLQLPAQRCADLEILNHSAFVWRKHKAVDTAPDVLALTDAFADGGKKGQRLLHLRIRLEHAPNPDSRITLDEGTTDALGQPVTKLHWAVGELEARTVAAVERAMAEQFGAARVGRFRIPDRAKPTDWEADVGWQDHLMGGTRMASDPTKGVVDGDGKVHGMTNLFVAGATVFPTSGHTNPTLNLVALALRLADHLAGEA